MGELENRTKACLGYCRENEIELRWSKSSLSRRAIQAIVFVGSCVKTEGADEC